MKSEFNERCYTLLQQVPEGKVTTYSEIARALGSKAWRAVGGAMAKNENLIIIPCHRVVRSTGEIGGYVSGADVKAALLIKEGVAVSAGRITDLEKFLYRF